MIQASQNDFEEYGIDQRTLLAMKEVGFPLLPALKRTSQEPVPGAGRQPPQQQHHDAQRNTRRPTAERHMAASRAPSSLALERVVASCWTTVGFAVIVGGGQKLGWAGVSVAAGRLRSVQASDAGGLGCSTARGRCLLSVAIVLYRLVTPYCFRHIHPNCLRVM